MQSESVVAVFGSFPSRDPIRAGLHKSGNYFRSVQGCCTRVYRDESLIVLGIQRRSDAIRSIREAERGSCRVDVLNVGVAGAAGDLNTGTALCAYGKVGAPQ